MVSKKMKTFFINAAIMIGASFSLRGISMVFRIYLSRRIGADGMGLYSLILSVYSLALTLAVSGLGLGVTRVIAERYGEQNDTSPRTMMRGALLVGLCFGTGAGILLFLLAPAASAVWLKEVTAVPALRLLALSLPASSLCGILNGYFTGMRQAYKNALLSAFVQITDIVLCICFLHCIPAPTTAVAAGGLVSEWIGALFSLSLYLSDMRKRNRADREPLPLLRGNRGLAEMLRISLPVAVTSYARSALLTVEHLLIPIGLCIYGASRTDALSSYGVIHGMVMPAVLFPMAVLSAVAGLSVPEFAAYRSAGRTDDTRRKITLLSVLTLSFAIGCAGIFMGFSEELGMLLFHSAQAGRYIRIFGTLVPVMYFDHVVDAMLKGLDQQVASMWYNLADSALSTAAVWILLPRYGIIAYVAIVFGSELFNASLSVGRLTGVSGVRLPIFKGILLPLFSIGSAVFLARRIVPALPPYLSDISTLSAHIILTVLIYAAILFLANNLLFVKRKCKGTTC